MPITTWKAGGLTDDEGIQDYGQDTLARLSQSWWECMDGAMAYQAHRRDQQSRGSSKG